MTRVCGSMITFSRMEPKRMAWYICGSASASITLA